jgi:hypothetical protein
MFFSWDGLFVLRAIPIYAQRSHILVFPAIFPAAHKAEKAKPKRPRCGGWLLAGRLRSQKYEPRRARLNSSTAATQCHNRKAVVCRSRHLSSFVITLRSVVEGMESSDASEGLDGVLFHGLSGSRSLKNEGENAGDDLGGSRGTSDDAGGELDASRGTPEDAVDYHIAWLFETDDGAEPSSGNDQDPTPGHRRCSNYQSLSKSSKRRVRRGVKKEEMRSEPGVPLEICSSGNQIWDFFHEKYVDEKMSLKRIQRWRERRIARKSDPFSTCGGEIHYFDCRDSFTVLCTCCAKSWRTGSYEDCMTTKRSMTFRFKQPCPDCLRLPRQEYRSWQKLIKGSPDLCRNLVDYRPIYIECDGTNFAEHVATHGEQTEEFYLISISVLHRLVGRR